MNKKWKDSKKVSKNSPVLFEDEEVGTSSVDEVKSTRTATATPRSKLRLSGHSTPIRKTKIKTDASDSPDLNSYNESPIEPLTQNPPNEVGWDFQRVKEDDISPMSMDINRTPKRNILLAKKRNSNSPLLYKPLKKKLIQEEQQENIEGFMAELEAIHLKTKQGEVSQISINNGKDQSQLVVDNEKDQSQLVVEMDSEPSDSDIKLQVSANSNESPEQNKIADKKCNELIDDSMEDMLVLCSQQVEAQEFGNKQEQCTKTTIVSTTNSKLYDTCSKSSSVSKEDSGSLEFPDDSFDEFLVGIDIEVDVDSDKKMNEKTSISISSTKSVINQNKFFQSKNSIVSTQVKTNNRTISSNYTKYTPATNASIQNKVINTKASYGYLNKEYARNSNSSGCDSQTQMSNNSSQNNETRLFKAKSFSDSNFLDQNNDNKFGKSYSNIDSMAKLRETNKNYGNQSIQSISTTENKTWRRVHSTSSLQNSNTRDNSQHTSVNKLGSSESSLSTPEEIERKRQEAIMRRNAKLKMKIVKR